MSYTIQISEANVARGMKPVTNPVLIVELVDAVRCQHCESTHTVVTPVDNAFDANVTTKHAKGCPVKQAINKFQNRRHRELYLDEAHRRTREVYQWMRREGISTQAEVAA